ncbi:MAG TPA: hypothetical protein VMZ03_01985 [Chitinophagaceae bacterium]|nr:hypothetical protein [Chitinophagaceae bacterium]
MQAEEPGKNEYRFNSFLSFRPLVEALKKNIREGNPGMLKLYGQVVAEFESHPELLKPLPDLDILFRHSELIEELVSAVFPPTTTNYMYGVSVPFKFRAVYASPVFKKKMIKPGTNEIIMPENQLGVHLTEQRLSAAYGLILKKYMGIIPPDTYHSTYTYPEESTGLTRYMELRLDTRFIDVRPVAEMPPLPDSVIDKQTNRMMKTEDLVQLIPLDKFIFEGLVVMRLNDVTQQAVVSEIKNKLLDFDAFVDNSGYIELEKYVQSLVCIKDVNIGVTPFFKINGHYVYSDLHNTNSILFRNLQPLEEKDEISDYCKLLFRDSNQPLLFQTLDTTALNDVQCLQYYYREGTRSLIICPLKQGNDLIGMLEISSNVPDLLKPSHIGKVESVLPLFTLGLEKSLDQLNNKVDKVIKKRFTAVQPAVEWKFTEVALNFIVNQHQKKDAPIDRITFDGVWPLYGAVDIRNSSVERSRSVQTDILDQLNTVQKIVTNARKKMNFPLLQELEFKIEKFIIAASDTLQSEEEMSINDFMKTQVQSVFTHLHSTEISLKNEIEEYFASLDPQTGMRYHHRKEYEASVTRINDTLSQFIDKEQLSAQKVYPHYFERYVTDGLDFNIYIGQAISPRKKFDEIYLHNLKMWQLSVLAKAARRTHTLEAELSRKLRTTQLILSYSQSLAVTFRTEERKFDVDGTYNVRYEIVKKRIDKAHIRDSAERITQPGKIAIIYSQAKDADEYTEYIEFLQNQGLLKPGIERYDIEDLQGISGLKALRVDVNFDDLDPAPVAPSEKATKEEVLGK